MDILFTGIHDPLVVILLFAAALCAGFVDAVVGGGGLILIPALMLGLPTAPATTALATNKLAAVCGTLSAAVTYQRKLPSPPLKLAILCPLAGILSALGAWTAMRVNPDILRPIILIAITAVGIFLIFRPEFGQERAHERHGTLVILATVAMIAAIGFYDGFFGPGTGMFLIIGFTLISRSSFLESASLAKALNAATNCGALIVFASGAQIQWALGLVLAAGNVCGALVGSRLVLTKGTSLIRVAMLAIIAVLVVKLGMQQFS
ncbi:MAG: TSUP family transporter [Actinomycetaceae bacterium]|nr:TSUP family transporter [Arcanobacterium sp.]MDD7687707.1 TSUP family transporter [Actinomycetaceae bacterium]MDY5274230.1 TSUP family transporter [Arcanobacterium sp.]